MQDYEELLDEKAELETEVRDLSKDPYIHCKTLEDEFMTKSFNDYRMNYSSSQLEYLLKNGQEFLKDKNIV